MADMADFINDSGPDDFLLYEPGGFKICRCCGTDRLHWVARSKDKWVLADEDGITHKCPVAPLPKHRPKDEDGYRVFVEFEIPGIGGGFINTLAKDFNKELTSLINRGAKVTKCEVRSSKDWLEK